MPATLALMKIYYDGAQRQRALSFWSIGSWGGGGLCALLGGVVDSTMGWRSIFWLSNAVALASWILIRGTPESRAEFDGGHRPLDWAGLVAFSIAAVAFNVVVNKGAALGWLNPAVLALGGGCAAALGALVWTARRCRHPFVDFRLFQNPIYLASTLSNFFLNGVAGSLLIVSLLVQQTDGLSSLESGLMTTGYLVAILATIRMGERLQQHWGGARRPMLVGCAVTGMGIALTTLTYLAAGAYIVVASVGFTLVGTGLGLYATPSTDAALSDVPEARAAEASAIYKMASSLGTAFGVTVAAAIFTALKTVDTHALLPLPVASTADKIRFAAAVALWFNVALVVFATCAIRFAAGKPGDDTRGEKWSPS
jgi:DHA2 family multidrug resistance protein-like MFS transporter